MQGLTDLEKNVGTLASEIGVVKAAVTDLKNQISTLQATVAAGGDNDADVETQAQAVAASVASLDAIVNPAPVVTPPATS